MILSKDDIRNLRSAVESCLTDPARPEDCQHLGCPYAAEAEETPLGSMLKCKDAMYADVLFLLDDIDSREDLINRIISHIQAEINPYGKPFEGTAYEFGQKLMQYLESMKAAMQVPDR